jgi:DNA-binding MarR family transcriptional regulator
MGLEEDIQQKKFRNEFEKLGINLVYTGSWIYNLNSARLKKFNLTPEQFNVLRILRGQHPSPVMLNEITRRMLNKSSNATRLVEKLKQKGLVTRKVCEQSRRQVDIAITDKGLAVLSKIDEGQEDWFKALKGVTKTEAKELNRLLDKLRGD